jgi:hypothetical protein
MADFVTGIGTARWVLGLRLGYATTRNNRIVEREYEDRFRWAVDDSDLQNLELAELAEEMNRQNLFFSGAHEGRPEGDPRAVRGAVARPEVRRRSANSG